MTNRIVGGVGRSQGHLTIGQPLAALDQPTLGEQVTRLRASEEVDVQTGCDRQFHDSDPRQHAGVKHHIGHPHHRRTGDRAARSQQIVPKRQPGDGESVIDSYKLDPHIAHQRHLFARDPIHLLDRHPCRHRTFPLPAG